MQARDLLRLAVDSAAASRAENEFALAYEFHDACF